MIQRTQLYSIVQAIVVVCMAAYFVAVHCGIASAATFSGAEHYVTARDAEYQARYADAIKSYEACAQHDRELAGYARVRAAVCRARGGDAAGAIERLRTLLASADDASWGALARIELATLLERQGQHAEAAPLFQKALALPLLPKWLLPYRRAYADSLIQLPDPASRKQGFDAFSTMLGEARTRAQRIESAKRLMNSPDTAQRMAAATTFINAGEWADANTTLNATEPVLGANAAKYATQVAYLRARVRLGTDADKEAARAALLSIAKADPKSEWGRLALAHAARSYFSAGKEPEVKPKKEPATEGQRRLAYRQTAAKLVELMTTEFAGTLETGDTLWWLANQYDVEKDPTLRDSAFAAFQQLFVVCPAHERAGDATYRAAALLRETDVASASKLFQQAYERYPVNGYAASAAYACGRIALTGNDKERAAAGFRAARDLGGLGNFYAHRASQRLAELGLETAHEKAIVTPGLSPYLRAMATESSAHKAPREKWLDRVRFFASHGYEEAEWEALAHIERILAPAHAVDYLAALSEAGLAATVSYIVDETGLGLKDDRPQPQILPALYPRAYWDVVQSTSRETGADPLLLLAIARQESLFQARIESHAGAAGVMQLMPSTASYIAKIEPSVGARHATELLKPASSVRLGGYYYRYILGKCAGNPIYAVASYNAGPGNVSRWRGRYVTTDMDEFIESIPFEETRDFVKKVFGNYAAYHSLYGQRSRLAESGEGKQGAGSTEVGSGSG